MKKLFTLVCVILLVSCVAKKPIVKTEGLEEVVVFGEDTSNVSEEAVLPTPTEPTVATLPLEEIAPPVSGEVTLPPAPVEEVVVPPPVIEYTPPPVTEVMPPVEEVIPPPPVVVYAPPLEEVSLATPPVPPVLEEGGPMVTLTPPPPTPATAPSQIFASSTEKNANRVADDARSPFGGKVYIEHVAPYYKVRVGDCLTSEEAQAIKSKAVNLGFKGAFVVETMINP